MLSVLRYTDSDYPFGIFKMQIMKITPPNVWDVEIYMFSYLYIDKLQTYDECSEFSLKETQSLFMWIIFSHPLDQVVR
jgi:hypothetical protein